MIARALLLLLVLAAPATAAAQEVSNPSDLGTPVDSLVASVRVQGDLTVSFTADPATCGQFGRCGDSGTLVYRPARATDLSIVAVRKGRVRTLVPLYYPSADDADVRIQTRRPRAGGGTAVCTEATTADNGIRADLGRDRVLTVGIRGDGPGPLDTTCGGPLWSDVRSALKEVRITQAQIARGFSADLRGQGTFTAGGLTATVRSTLVLRSGRPAHDPLNRFSDGRSGDEEGPPTQRWRLASARGTVRVEQRSTGPSTRCTVLDTCGLVAQATLTPQPRLTDAEVITAVDEHGLAGSGAWVERGGVRTTVAREDAVPCGDGAPLLAGLLMLGRTGKTVTAVYSAPFARSRCGGLDLGGFFDGGLATATVPVSAFSGRRVTLRFDRGVDTTASGVRTTTTSDLVVELVRR